LIGLLKGMDFGRINNTLNNEDFFLFTSAIVVGELYYGISDTNNIEDNRAVIQ
jgi:predicted nucleic acid-binding protein